MATTKIKACDGNRAKNLEEIAKTVRNLGLGYRSRILKGYAEQLEIIADEIKPFYKLNKTVFKKYGHQIKTGKVVEISIRETGVFYVVITAEGIRLWPVNECFDSEKECRNANS